MTTTEYLERFGFKELSHPDPLQRMRHRMTFRNERALYKRTSALSGKNVISIYAPESPYKVYAADEWWSDKWDGADFGREVDFSRPFFEQLAELQKEVPRISLFNVNPYNSDYCQQAYNNKNCYLCTVVMECEDCMYLSHANGIKDSYDCDYIQRCELCYDCTGGEDLYACIGSDNCHSSSELIFCLDCIGCKNCFGCWGLRNAQYQMFNVPYSKDEYLAMVSKISLYKQSEYQHWANTCREECKAQHKRTEYLVNTEDCTGNHLVSAQLCTNCFDSFGLKECTNCTWTFDSTYCVEVYGMGTSEWVYEAVGVEKLNFAAFNTFVSDSGNSLYSDLCFYCTDIFGCVGLRRKKYSILNKQYSADEYQALTQKLVAHMQRSGEWGKFFPQNMSPFAYNESVAQERFPLTEEQAKKLGYRWKKDDPKDYKVDNYVVADNSLEVSGDITTKVLACKNTGKGFRIIGKELEFYQQNKLPIPQLAPDTRYYTRMLRRRSK